MGQHAPEARVLDARGSATSLTAISRTSNRDQTSKSRVTPLLELIHTAFGTIRSRNRCNEFRLVLPEAEMVPAAFPSVVDTALLSSAGTLEMLCTFDEINGKGELFGLAFEGAGSHRPRMREGKSLREKLIRVHA